MFKTFTMKKKLKLSLFLLLLLLIRGFNPAIAQNLVIESIDGNEDIKAISNIQKMAFSGFDLLLNLNDNTDLSFQLSTVRKIYFSSVLTNIDEFSSSTNTYSISIYPNPTQDYLYFTNLVDDDVVATIYGIDGNLLVQKSISGSANIDVSGLEKGLYILKVKNQALKFIKQ